MVKDFTLFTWASSGAWRRSVIREGRLQVWKTVLTLLKRAESGEMGVFLTGESGGVQG